VTLTQPHAAEQTTWVATAAGEDAVLRLHQPTAPGAGTAVVLVPPFGWDDMCSYRPRRAMALRLAAAGVPAARLELPGAGDAEGGPWDADRLTAWTASVAAAAAHLRGVEGVQRVAAFGVGLGALLAWTAAAEGAAVDDLALWAMPANGRQLVRELRALSRLETQLPGGDPLPDGALAAAGYVLSGQTLAELGAVDFAERPLGGGAGRRVLLLGRDGLAPPAAVVAAAEAGGARVELAPGPGFGAMLREPQWAEEPVTVAERLVAWAVASQESSPLFAPPPPALRDVLRLPAVRERALVLTGPRGGLPALIAEPDGTAAGAAGVRALLLNAGPQRHIGPNRLWVETARRWAARGVPTARVDLGGIGDAQTADVAHRDVGELYTDDYVAEARVVLEELDDGRPVLVAGLCSGGYWGLHAALEDERVAAVVLLNPRVLIWSRARFELNDARNFSHQLLDPASWRKVLRGQVSWRRPLRLSRAVLRHLLRRLARRPHRFVVAEDPLGALLHRLPERGTRLTLVFSGDEELAAELDAVGHLERLAAHPLVDVHRIGDPAVDTHTLRPPALQREVATILDAALDAVAGPAASRVD